MATKPLARDELWDVAITRLGFVTAQQAGAVGVGKAALQMLVQRGTLTRVAHGVYRFPQFPAGQYDLHAAVLWTRAPEACLSHETALDAYEISDVNPNRIHVTVAKHRRLRRTEGGEDYVIHREDLGPTQVGWWQEIPTVTPETAIAQCIAYGTPTYLLRQAIDRGHVRGYLKVAQRDHLAKALEARHEP